MRKFGLFLRDIKGYEEEIECFLKCVEYVQRTRAYVRGDIFNIEYLLSVLTLTEIADPGYEIRIGRRRYRISRALDLLKKLIWRVYSKIPNLRRLQRYDWFAKLIKEQRLGGSQIDIITTNYDLLPELLMHRSLCASALPFEWESISIREPEQQRIIKKQERLESDWKWAPFARPTPLYATNNGVSLYKLHGSVNWFSKDRMRTVHSYDEFYPRQKPDGSAGDRGLAWPAFVQTTVPDGFRPLIIPPTAMKDYSNPAIRKSWQGAAAAMADADRIMFIGYSFPQSDPVMHFFLGTALAKHRWGCPIYIFDPDEPGVSGALKKIFVDHFPDRDIEILPYPFGKPQTREKTREVLGLP